VPAVRSRILQRSRGRLRSHLHQVQLPRARRHLPSPHRRLPQLRAAPATCFSCYSRARHLLPLLPGEVYRGHLGSSLQEQISQQNGFFSTSGLLFLRKSFYLFPELQIRANLKKKIGSFFGTGKRLLRSANILLPV
jgi:hypothetical protein